MKKAAGLLALTLIMLGPVLGQRSGERIAGELRGFERNWLTAYLNDDSGWLSRFSTGKLNIIPAPGMSFENREVAVSELTGTDLQANEMKVRISGTISLLTNDTSLNRTFYFLDTFNKTGGKWRAIASSISPVPAIGAQEAREELLKLENGRSQAVLSGDVSALERLIAPEFVSTSFQGQAEDRGQWITAQKTQRIKSSVLSEMRVDLVSDNVAVVTGVETSVGSIDNEAEVTNADRFTHTWARRGGRWQCVAAHVTRIK